MKVKKYQRKGGKQMTGQQYKRKMWKEKMSARSKSYGDNCFKCGQSGHWASKCTGGMKVDLNGLNVAKLINFLKKHIVN